MKRTTIKKIISTITLAVFFATGIPIAQDTGSSYSPNINTLAPYSNFTEPARLESPNVFSGSLLRNKQFVLAAMSVADHMALESGTADSLPKWIRHNLSGVPREWADLFDTDSVRVEGSLVRIPFSFRGTKLEAEVFVSAQEGSVSGAFNITVKERSKPLSAQAQKQPAAAFVPSKQKIVKIGFSVLSADESNIVREVAAAKEAGVDRIHLDYLDGIFTPGLAPFDCLGQIKKTHHLSIPLDVHLMARSPDSNLVQNMIKAGLKPGRDRIFVHYEAFQSTAELRALCEFTKAQGLGMCLAINPETQVSNLVRPLSELRDYMDGIMVMAIIPGAGSRPFIEESMGKIRELKELLRSWGYYDRIKLLADGGLNEFSVRTVIASGVDELTTRTWLIQPGKDMAEKVTAIKNLSRHMIESAQLKEMMETWDLPNYQYLVDAIVKFCKGDDTFTKAELITSLKRFTDVKEIRITDDRVVDVIYPDKLLRFHKDGIIPIEHLGLRDRVYYDGAVVKIYTGNVTNRTQGEYILGISGSWHDSTAALIKDGKVVAALEEERMTRTKHDSSLFPANAIIRLLEHEGITWNDIKHVTFGWNFNLYVDTRHSENPNDEFFRDMDERYAVEKGMSPEKVTRRRSSERNKDRFKVVKVEAFLDEMAEHYHTEYNPRVSFVGHSRSHAASAYYLCGFDEKVLTLALDGYGDFESGGVWVGENGKMTELTRFQLPNSLGWVYCAITEYLGFKPSADEGQVMGFAPYGEPWDAKEMDRVNALREIFRDFIKFDPKKQVLVVNPDYYYYGTMVPSKSRITKTLQRRLSELGITPSTKNVAHLDPFNPNDRAYANLAYVLQERTSEVICDIVRFYLRDNDRTKDIRKLALAGGVTLNILANGRLVEDGLVHGDSIFVQPAANDAGTAIGSALTVAREIYGNKVTSEMDHALYGPDYTDDDIEKVLKEFGLEEGVDYVRAKDDKDVVERATEYIKDISPEDSQDKRKTRAIAWFQGKSELGPRALGARSILLNLEDVQANNTANIVKGRQPWRPSASSITEEAAPDYFRGIVRSPFMVIAFPVLYKKQKVVRAGLHEFGEKLARPQTVSRKAGGIYWSLLSRLGDLMGVPAVVNTSFNKQEPLVENPEEALNTFYYMDMVEYMYIGHFVVNKRHNLKPRIISLQDEEDIRALIRRAQKTGDISEWIRVFEGISGKYPNCHMINVDMDCGKYGMRKISIPLVKDIFSGPLRNSVLNFVAGIINDQATEYNAQHIYIGSTSKKMERVVFSYIKEKLEANFPRMDYFANLGDKVLVSPAPDKIKRHQAEHMSAAVDRLTEKEKKGTYIGIDVGATRIKCVLIKDGSVVDTGVAYTTFQGGKPLGTKIQEMVADISKGQKLSGIGISLPGVVDSTRNEIKWLVTYEAKWKESGLDIGSEYQKLANQLVLLREKTDVPDITLLNDGTAFGINSLNENDADDATLVVLGTGIGTARINGGKVDVSRIEQSSAFALDVRENAPFDAVCGVKGSFAGVLRDAGGNVIDAAKLAKKMVSWFKLMHSVRNDRNFILTGGVIEGDYGKKLISAIQKALKREKLDDTISVRPSGVDKTYGGAIGAAQFAMKKSKRNVIDAIHRINLSLAKPSPPGTKLNLIITEELIPISMRDTFKSFLKTLYGKYPFLKEKEEIHVASRNDLEHVIGSIMAEEKQKNIIDVALGDTNDFSKLPKGVKALVFSTEEKIDLIHLEGIIACLRALEQGNAPCLIKLFELLTSKEFNLTLYSEQDILDNLNNPEKLAKILPFELQPAIPFTDSLGLFDTLLRYIEEAA